MTQEQIAALPLRRDRAQAAIAALEMLIETGSTSNQSRITSALDAAESAAADLESAVASLTPP